MQSKSYLKISVIALFTMLSILSVASCEPRVLESEVAFADPILDNMLSAIAENDYGKFSVNLSDAMKSAIEKDGFPSLVSKMKDSLGEYRGRTFKRAVKAVAKGGMDLVIISYTATFEKTDKAIITVYISDLTGKKIVEGFMAVPSGESK
jgi:hypothetical protein